MKIVGHRGASHLAEDNTLESIQIALDYGVDYVEVDLQPTKDDDFLIFHDDDIELPSGEKAKISKLSSAELAELFPRELKRKALFIDDVVDYIRVKSPSAGLVLDCKNIWWAKSLAKRLKKYDQQGIKNDRFIVLSFSYIGLFLFRLRKHQVKTFYLWRHTPFLHLPLTKISGFAGAGYYITDNKILLPIKLIQKFKIKLFFYNVNNADFAKKCEKIGIEYIETDEPNIIVPAIRTT